VGPGTNLNESTDCDVTGGDRRRFFSRWPLDGIA